MVLGCSQLENIQQVCRAGQQCPGQITITTTDPGPGAVLLEIFTERIARCLRDAIEPRCIVCQGGAVPEQILRDIRPGAKIRQPVLATCVEDEIQPVRMAVSPAGGPTFEA